MRLLILPPDRGGGSKAAEQPLQPPKSPSIASGCCEGAAMKAPLKPVCKLNDEHDQESGYVEARTDDEEACSLCKHFGHKNADCNSQGNTPDPPFSRQNTTQWVKVENALMMLDQGSVQECNSEVIVMPFQILHPTCPTNFNPRDLEPADAPIGKQAQASLKVLPTE
ncbi:hypothetical protein Salat_1404700 [Sesamum alatum]|uniref:Uncharacterized protein n=1 Tax=Sesamum alatum TaxID=300844 RepID=A0AAE1YAT3_9LAMI|nr:hypothetical protein Salat_1404700 [Sesamum alatum]